MPEQQEQGKPPEERGITSRIGPVQIDWARMVGYYAGIGLAVGFEMIEPPVGLFIAAIPFFKMLNRPQAALPTRIVSQFLDGASKPVGGDSEGVIRLIPDASPRSLSIHREARQLADARRAPGKDANGARRGRRTRQVAEASVE